MRARTAAIVALLLLPAPAVLGAQRLPRTGTGGVSRRPAPDAPAPLPPQIDPVARAVAYKRSRISVEPYAMVSHFDAPGFSAAHQLPPWTSLGAGTHADYRLQEFLSATMDVTSSLIGGPGYTSTAELGMRLGTLRAEGRLYPFVDGRLGYVAIYDRGGSQMTNGPFGDPTLTRYASFGDRFHRGPGLVAGTGLEYTLTPTLSLTTEALAMRSWMTARTVEGTQTIDRHYGMTSYRWMLGLRYNPLRAARLVQKSTDATSRH